MSQIKRIVKRAFHQARRYTASLPSRLGITSSTTSADMELYMSLATLRNHSRALCRDNPYAKRAKQLHVNNIIGTGVGMQARVENRHHRLSTIINESIERAWMEFCDDCHIGGCFAFADLERALMAEVFEAGEVFVRLHYCGGQLLLELIESERVADDAEINAVDDGHIVTMGIEHDQYHKPVAYYFHRYHRGALRLPQQSASRDCVIRVPVDQIIHIKQTDRWPQTRGAPWLHAVMDRMHQHAMFESAAVKAARVGAASAAFLERSDALPLDQTEPEDDDSDIELNRLDIAEGMVNELPPGYKLVSWSPTFPSNEFDPFVNASMRGQAAGLGCSHQSLSCNYSAVSYSSARSSALDERDTWRSAQQWWIRIFRKPLHRAWLQHAIINDLITEISKEDYFLNRRRYEAVKFSPRGWSWVDPTKEVKAFKEAELAGYITKSDIIMNTANGLDFDDIVKQRRREIDQLMANDIITDTVIISDEEETAD
jgi:lambda family phage portal protein